MVLTAECFVARLALTTAHKLSLSHVTLKGDSLEVISLILDREGPVPWAVCGPIHDCHMLCSIVTLFSCTHTRRCANAAADRLAKSGLGSMSVKEWAMTPPLCIEPELSLDVAALCNILLINRFVVYIKKKKKRRKNDLGGVWINLCTITCDF